MGNNNGRIKVEVSPLGTGRWLRIWEISDPTSAGVHMSRAGFTTWLEAVKEGAFTPEEHYDLLRLNIGDLVAGARTTVVTTPASWKRFVADAEKGHFDEYTART
ncbi:hypothetical protein DP939_18260 [Spongiactinospora rosea]|uniref:Uncharacterized protein n=1 Tax=Spongiactinospora rosea TaxID=2248750 RepID=A0A366LWX0_9ACTN|nr:hypothetical protein [Spongiactinospora rosea]RBQ18458.1 hypothetical protein DP939_18260 [Spongiactinospora rosea]